MWKLSFINIFKDNIPLKILVVAFTSFITISFVYFLLPRYSLSITMYPCFTTVYSLHGFLEPGYGDTVFTKVREGIVSNSGTRSWS